MEQEWAANSYKEGYLDVYGEKHKVTFDSRLRDAVAPQVLGISKGHLAVRQTLAYVLRQAKRVATLVLNSISSVGTTKKELAETEQKLKETTKNLAQARRRIQRLLEHNKETNRSLREMARDYLVASAPRGSVCAEIGVHEGDLSRRILDIAEPKRLHLIDPWAKGEGLFGKQAVHEQDVVEKRYEKVKEQFGKDIEAGRVRIHRELSSDAVTEFPDAYFDWVYVDGNHLYEFVKQDLELYYPKVKAGGYVAGDDYGIRGYWDNGVQKAVDEFVSQHPDTTLEFKSTQFIIRKVDTVL